MKKILLILFAFVLLTGCTNEELQDNKSNMEGQEVAYKVNIEPDYLYMYPKDLYETSTLVVIASFKSNVKTYMDSSEMAYTIAKFKIENVLKGKETKKNIDIKYMGGSISLKEFLENKTEEQIKKYGLENVDATGKYVEFSDPDKLVKLDKNKEYVLFLNQDNSGKSDYIAVSNGYSILEVVDGKIYDEKTSSYISIESLK